MTIAELRKGPKIPEPSTTPYADIARSAVRTLDRKEARVTGFLYLICTDRKSTDRTTARKGCGQTLMVNAPVDWNRELTEAILNRILPDNCRHRPLEEVELLDEDLYAYQSANGRDREDIQWGKPGRPKGYRVQRKGIKEAEL